MLHHNITKLDIEKLADMSSNDLEQYLRDIVHRIDHLDAMKREAEELAQAVSERISDRRLTKK